MFWVLNAHNDEILSRVGSLRAAEKSVCMSEREDEQLRERISASVCFVQRSVYIGLNIALKLT